MVELRKLLNIKQTRHATSKGNTQYPRMHTLWKNELSSMDNGGNGNTVSLREAGMMDRFEDQLSPWVCRSTTSQPVWGLWE